MEFSDSKLNIFQRGILQKTFTLLTYAICSSLIALFIEWIDKQWFISTIYEYYHNGKLSEKAAQVFSLVIESRGSIAVLVMIVVIIVCGLLCFVFMRCAAQLNWSSCVTLAKVIEFRKAMEAIDIFTPEERVEFVIKSKVPLYIACAPIIGMEKENVKVKFYALANYDYLSSADTINKYTGEQLLCIESNDYEYILKNYGNEKKSAYLSKISDLETTVKNLKGTLSVCQQDMNVLTEEKKQLVEENGTLSQKLKTLPGREESTEKRERDRILFWRVAAPLVNRLIAEAEPGDSYSRPQIQAAFELELENFPELKADIQRLLYTTKKDAQNTPLALDGWAMELIRAALGDLARKDPGATRKR